MKLVLAQRVPSEYSADFMASLLRDIENQVNPLSEGRASAYYGARTAPPTTGDWSRGDWVKNSEPSVDGQFGWVCVEGGTPGTWVGIGGSVGLIELAANTFPARASTGDVEAKPITDFALSLVDDSDASSMRTTLGLGTIATQNANSVAITGGNITGIVDLAVADGGTGASDASGARTNLGLVIGTHVQAQDATLQALANLTISANSLIIGTGSDAFSLTTFAANTFPARASSGNLVAKTITDFGLSLVDDADASTARSTLGLVIGTNVQAWDADLDALSTAFVRATSAGPASLAFHEDTDNGTNKITVQGAASIASDLTLTLPAATDTLVGKATTDTLTNKTINLTSNTLVTTLAQLNSAISDADVLADPVGFTIAVESDADVSASPMLAMYADANPGLKLYLADESGGTRLYLWDNTQTMPNLPHTGIKPTFAVHGDIYVGDIIALANNPMTYFMRVATGLTADKVTQLFSSKGGNDDTDGGATIVYAPMEGGTSSDGYVKLIAYGNGSGSEANEIIFAQRSGVDTVTSRWAVGGSGVFYPKQDGTLDIGTTNNQVQIVYAEGVHFPATQAASADANTLDDYEEGTWTPTLTFATPGNLSVSYSIRQGQYTKIGRQITIWGAIVTSAFTHTTASGNLNISGIPSAIASNNYARGAIQFSGISKANYTDFVASLDSTESVVTVVADAQGQSSSAVTAADMPSGGSVTLIFTMTYNV